MKIVLKSQGRKARNRFQFGNQKNPKEWLMTKRKTEKPKQIPHNNNRNLDSFNLPESFNFMYMIIAIMKPKQSDKNNFNFGFDNQPE